MCSQSSGSSCRSDQYLFAASMVCSQYENVRSFLVTPSLIAVLLGASDPACVPKTTALGPVNLTRNLFFSYLGTGSITTGMLFSVFPYWNGSGELLVLSTTFFFLNLLLFALFCVVSTVRYWRYPCLWSATLRHPVQSLFFCTFPTDALTLLGAATMVLHEAGRFRRARVPLHDLGILVCRRRAVRTGAHGASSTSCAGATPSSFQLLHVR